MARTVSEIKQQFIDEKNNYPLLAGIDLSSSTSILGLIFHVVAVGISYFEQLLDQVKTDVEALTDKGYVGTHQWVKDKVLEFQYSATEPQVVNYNSTTKKIEYSLVDETLQIITRCSVETDFSKNVNIKVAKSDPPTQLVTAEKNSLDSYLKELIPAGVSYTVINAVSDKLFLDADIYYNGQYASTIATDVKTAINDYLKNLEFNGKVRISDLEVAIKSVAGVKDIVIDNMICRRDGVALVNANYMVQDKKVLVKDYIADAGYIVEETTSGSTLTDKLTFIIAQ